MYRIRSFVKMSTRHPTGNLLVKLLELNEVLGPGSLILPARLEVIRAETCQSFGLFSQMVRFTRKTYSPPCACYWVGKGGVWDDNFTMNSIKNPPPILSARADQDFPPRGGGYLQIA